ncbi:MAG TPA: DUF2024 family protein [Ignavibacteria bacterium]|nr:DUF2024 family protein [Ignavibacteria bacterium]HQY52853.1 DUF2024 family protein [Ignavibacteria bacterium]HRB00834.1 DUF2024 family protein [Ignavibacteria bacterium]
MKVTVWDTYVTKKDGTNMHFDIIAPEEICDQSVIHKYGKEYLISRGEDGQHLTSNECKRCHVEEIQPKWKSDIIEKGYYIVEMENC